MRRIFGIIIAICILIQSSACVLSSPIIQNTPTPIVPTSSAQDNSMKIIIIRTEDPNYAEAIIFPDKSVIIEKNETDSSGIITNVYGAIFVTPDGKTIYISFENGLPARAVVENQIIEYSNFTDTTVDITIIHPDGSTSITRNIPFDRKKIHYPKLTNNNNNGKHALADLAIPISRSYTENFDWADFTTTIVGAAFCVGTVASGGTLTPLFGAGCAIFVFSKMFEATGMEVPVVVEGAGWLIGSTSCVVAFIEKDPNASVSCAKLFVSFAAKVYDEAIKTEVSILTKTPTITATEIQNTPTPTSIVIPATSTHDNNNGLTLRPTITLIPGFTGLTPEELTNQGTHTYDITCKAYYNCGCQGLVNPEESITITFDETGVTSGSGTKSGSSQKIWPNLYKSTFESGYVYVTFLPDGYEESFFTISSQFNLCMLYSFKIKQ